MGRTGHYLQRPTRATIPAVWIAVVCDPIETGRRSFPHVTHRKWGSAVVAVTYRNRRKWSKPELIRVGSGDKLRSTLHELAVPGRDNWVITPSVAETFTLSGTWHVWESQGIVWGRSGRSSQGARADDRTDSRVCIEQMALTSATGLICCRVDGRNYRWINAGNLGFVSPRNQAGGQATPEPHEPSSAGRVGLTERSSSTLARDMLTFVARWCDWWRDNAARPWGATCGQLAMRMLESYTPKGILSTHENPAVHALERSASFGGRASVWYVGNALCRSIRSEPTSEQNSESRKISSPYRISLVDVRSMYPYLMLSRPFPVRLISHQINPSITILHTAIEKYAVIARVSLATRLPEYPLRRADRVEYPVGVFTTTLTGPELLKLREHGEILQCHEMAIYHSSYVFAAVAAKLLDSREIARSAGDAGGELFVKRISNALAGKLAQRSGEWVREQTHDAPGTWGESFDVYPKTGTVTRWRHICGLAWRWVEDETGRGPYTFAFAYLAAYGRLLMRSIREQLPARSVLSQDTDGLWVTDAGTLALKEKGLLGGAEPGALRIKHTARSIRFWGPRHYTYDGNWVLAGFSMPVHEDGGESIWTEVIQYPWQQGVRSAPDQTHIVHRKCRLHVESGHGVVGEDGWITPTEVKPVELASKLREFLSG